MEPQPPTNLLQFRTFLWLLLYTLETLSIHIINFSIVQLIGRTGEGAPSTSLCKKEAIYLSDGRSTKTMCDVFF